MHALQHPFSQCASVADAHWWQNNVLISALVTLLCFGITYFFFGFYYVDYQGMFDAFYSGMLTPDMPFRSIYFLAHIGISHIYSLLYEYIQKVEWISYILYSYLLFAAFIGLYLTAVVLPEKTPTWLKVTLQLLVYWQVFTDHQLHFIYTRVSYITCGLSLLGLVVLFPTRESIRQHRGLFLLLNLFLTLGILTRVESATATISLLVFFGWFYLQEIPQWFRLFSYPILLTFALIIGITYQIKTGHEFYLQIEPDIEVQYNERQNIVPISTMKTHRDSVLYSTAFAIMWSDPSILTSSYLRSLIQPEGFIYTDARQWHRTFTDLQNIFWKYRFQIILWLLLSSALYIQYPFRSRPYSLGYWLVFEGSFWLLNTLQTYTAKINDRSFAPYLSLFIFCHIVLLIQNLNVQFSKWLYPLFLGCFVLFIIHVYELKTEANILQADLLTYQNNFEKIRQVASNRYLVLNATSLDYLCLANVPFHPFDFSAFKKIYITDGSMIPFLPYYKRYLEKECNCNIYAFPSFWNYLKKIKKDVVIVSSPKRMKLVQDYLEEVHQFQLLVVEKDSVQLKEERKSENRENPDEMKVYFFEE